MQREQEPGRYVFMSEPEAHRANEDDLAHLEELQELHIADKDRLDHSRTKTKSPQTNGICERFHKTVLNEFYRVAFSKKGYRSIDELAGRRLASRQLSRNDR